MSAGKTRLNVFKKNISVLLSYCITAVLLWSIQAGAVRAATTWSSLSYDLYTGDFDGDGKMDILYIAKDPTNISGIDLSDGSGPNVPLQSWPSNYLNIPWYGNQFTVIVADFNGDGHADILLQANTPGDSYLLLANQQGMITGISQAIPSTLGGLGWSADQHHLVAGDFNHDGRADLFLQATSAAGTNAVFLAEANGQFAAADLTQQWNDGYLGFSWATTESVVYAGDFNGDHYADLLIQARPQWVLINYEVPFPVPHFPPNCDGVVLASPSGSLFQASGVQAWSVNAFGANWSPLVSNLVIGDFNGDQNAEVLLQGKNATRASVLVTGNSSGTIFSAVPLASNETYTADGYRLLAVNFSGSGPAGIYAQATAATGTNYYITGIGGGTASVTAEVPAAASQVIDYTYDALGRLTLVVRTGTATNNVQTQYTYDAAGNRTGVTVTGAAQ